MTDFATNFWLNRLVKIHVFDDGNLPVSNKYNIWVVTATHFNGDKLQLENCIDLTLKIPSISAWKVTILDTSNNDGNPQ